MSTRWRQFIYIYLLIFLTSFFFLNYKINKFISHFYHVIVSGVRILSRYLKITDRREGVVDNSI